MQGRQEGAMNEASEKLKRVMAIFLQDVRLLASLFVARFIVWRSTRSGGRERRL